MIKEMVKKPLTPTKKKGKSGDLFLREKFLIFPKCIYGKWKWWRKAIWAEEYYVGACMIPGERYVLFRCLKHFSVAWIESKKDWTREKREHTVRAKRQTKMINDLMQRHHKEREMQRKYCKPCNSRGFFG